MRQAKIYYKIRFAGLLAEDEKGTFRFSYDDLYRIDGSPIAYSIPISNKPFVSNGLPAFFDNLISEGWMRRIQSTSQHIDENDSFGLLLHNGRDLVGAVSVLPDEEDR